MAREKGTFNFSANLEVKKQGPLDARQSLITYTELTQAATWQDENGKMYLFDGLTVPVINGEEKQYYMLIDAAKYNLPASWKRIDADTTREIKKYDLTSLNRMSTPQDIEDILGKPNDFLSEIDNNTVIGQILFEHSSLKEPIRVNSFFYHVNGVEFNFGTTVLEKNLDYFILYTFFKSEIYYFFISYNSVENKYVSFKFSNNTKFSLINTTNISKNLAYSYNENSVATADVLKRIITIGDITSLTEDSSIEEYKKVFSNILLNIPSESPSFSDIVGEIYQSYRQFSTSLFYAVKENNDFSANKLIKVDLVYADPLVSESEIFIKLEYIYKDEIYTLGLSRESGIISITKKWIGSDVYVLPGRVEHITNESTSEELLGILGPLEDLKNAIKSNKIIVGKADYGGGSIFGGTETFSNVYIDELGGYNNITFIKPFDGSSLITLTKINVSEEGYISATVQKGIIDVAEEGGLKVEEPGLLSIKIDETTPGNVQLSTSANGLKANVELPEQAKEVYLIPGDITTLSLSSGAADIKSVYGELNSFKEALTTNKVIIGTINNVGYYINAGLDDSTHIIVSANIGIGLLLHRITISASDYVSIEVTESQLAVSGEVVESVTATTNKGIEIGGTATKPTVGLKLDNSGNVKLSTGASGLKANVELPEQAKEVYVLPDKLDTLSTGSSVSVIKQVLGNFSELKNAIDNNLVILGQISSNKSAVRYHIDSSNSRIYIEISRTAYDVAEIIINYSGTEYTSIEAVNQRPLADGSKVIKAITGNNGILVNGTSDYPSIKIKPDTTTPGNVDLTTSTNGLKATLSTKAVKSGNKILKVESDKSISATVSLGYDSEGKKLQLKGINDEVFNELDATPFIKDGMLNSAELAVNPSGQSAGTYIKLVFNTDSGKDPIYINVTSLIDVYTQGNGISISGKKISVKLDTTGNTEGYLKLTSAGLKVEGVNSAIAAAIAEAFSWHDA